MCAPVGFADEKIHWDHIRVRAVLHSSKVIASSRGTFLQPILPGESGFKPEDMRLSFRANLTTQDVTDANGVRPPPCTLRLPHLDGSIEWQYGHLDREGGGDPDDETQNAPEAFPCPGYGWSKSWYSDKSERLWRVAFILATVHVPQQCPPSFEYEAPDGTKVKFHYQILFEQNIRRPTRAEDAFVSLPIDIDVSSGRLPAASMDDKMESNTDDLAPPPAYAP